LQFQEVRVQNGGAGRVYAYQVEKWRFLWWQKTGSLWFLAPGGRLQSPSEDLWVQKSALPGDELLGPPSIESSELGEPKPFTRIMRKW